MSEALFAEYLRTSILTYAAENVTAERWPAEGAHERSAADFHRLLPQGLATSKHHLCEIKTAEDGPTLGIFWWAEEDPHGVRRAYVYDVAVKEAYQRQGHARRAFQALESLAAGLGLSSIGLHVFAHNAGAQVLYAQLGYAVTSMNMLKKLDAPA